MKTIQHFINGKATAGNGKLFLEVYNPTLGEVSARVAVADKSDVDAAVAIAQKTFATWSETPLIKRSQILFRYRELLEKHIDELAQLVNEEHGKTVEDAKGSVKRGIEVVELACNSPYLLRGNFSENVSTGVDCYTIRQALGVCAGITPFNFPAMVPNWMFAIPIACGNTFVLKPSEKDPSCTLRMVELFKEAGLPDGVLNVVNGNKDTVNALITHPDVKAVSIVGSTPVIKHVCTTAMNHGKRAQGFGSAKNHCVIMPDADLDWTASQLAGAAFGSAGERCMAISVAVVVGDKAADQLVKKLQEHIAQFKIGCGKDKNIDIGPLVTQEHLERVKNYVSIGIEEGAKLIVDGRDKKIANYEKGFFMGACLFDHVKSSMRIYREEIFGPVLSIVRVRDVAEALQLINAHTYGNGTAIFTRDGEIAREFAHRVQVGMVGINVPIPVPAASHSFGGWKESIVGDTNMYGEESYRFYTQLKTITARWPENKNHAPEFSMPVHG